MASDQRRMDPEEAKRQTHAKWRDEKIIEAMREGYEWLIIPLPNGGQEKIDLRLH